MKASTGTEHGGDGRLWPWVVVVVLGAVVLRWANLGGWDLWTDEVQTLWVSSSGEFKEGPLYRTAPLNFIVTGWAVEMLGERILAARVVPFLAGSLTVAIYYPVMKRWLGGRAALFGTLALSLSFWHVGWSQTARHFALEVLLLLGALHGFLLYWREGSRVGLAAMAVLLLASLFTHSSAGFVLVAMVVFLAAQWLLARAKGDTGGTLKRNDRRRLVALAACAVVLAVYLPVYLQVGSYLLENKRAWNPPYNILGSLTFYVSPVLALFGLAGVGYLKAEGDDLWLLLLSVAVVPPLLVSTAGAFTISTGAYALPAMLAVAALVGVTADRLLETRAARRSAVVGAALVAVPFLSEAYALAHYYSVWNGLKPRWGEAVAYVESHRRPDEGLWAAEGDVAQYYAGLGRADWVGRYGAGAEADTTGQNEAPAGWFAVYLDPSPGPLSAGDALAGARVPSGASVRAIFPLHYGAKDRTIVVYRLAESETSPVGATHSPAARRSRDEP